MNLDLTLLSTILTSLAALFSLFYMIHTTRSLKNKLSDYEPMIQDVAGIFRFEKAEDGSVLMDERLNTLMQAATGGIAKSIQMSIMGSLSGSARMEKGLKGAIAADIIEEKMPLVNMVGDFMGINTKKYITKHPDAIGQLASLAGPYLQDLMKGRNNGQMMPASQAGGRAGYG